MCPRYGFKTTVRQLLKGAKRSNVKSSECKPGRIFVLCLENGDIVHQEIEQFAKIQSIEAASLIIIGGAAKGSKLITGPKQENEMPVSALEIVLDDVHEIAGAGTLFPDQQGNPVLHLHMACGLWQPHPATIPSKSRAVPFSKVHLSSDIWLLFSIL